MRRLTTTSSVLIGIIAVVAIVLSGCGTAPPKIDRVMCPADGYATTHFCLTPAEVALGQSNVHSPTIPDIYIIQGGATLTMTSSGVSQATISQEQAAAIAFADINNSAELPNPPNGPAHYNSAVLAQMHDGHGNPAQGQLVWLVDETPIGGVLSLCGGGSACTQPPVADQFAWVAVDALTGTVIETYTT